MNFMHRWRLLGIAALALSGVSGCEAPPTPAKLSSSSSLGAKSLTVSQLPNVPGCGAVSPTGTLQAVPVEGQADLYLVTEEGKPLCIDDGAGVADFEARTYAKVTASPIDVPGGESDSDPMPCRDPGFTGSDPAPTHRPEIETLGKSGSIEQRR